MRASWPAAAAAAVTVALTTHLSNASFLVDHITTNLTVAVNKAVTQQDIAVAPPLPILQIGLEHILAQIGINTSTPGTGTTTAQTAKYAASEVLKARDTLAECGPNQPCIDGSCCNSDGKCGFTSYNCQTTAAATCISNCNAYAMCGVDSLNSATVCPLNICCSKYGYCGTTDIYCTDSTETYCQGGYGSCEIIPPPSCSIAEGTASNGRRVAYWQSGNVRWRSCNRIAPSQINTTGLTHLVFAFAAIDPTTFEIVPVDPGDFAAYQLFTDLKSTVMQTWIAIGGGGFTDPGSPTIDTWSDMSSNANSRAAFISSLENFLRTWGFQGVDLDWEYPTVTSRGGQPGDTANFVTLVKEMRAAWGSEFGISVSIPIDFADLMGYDVGSMQEYIDFFNAMAYDLHGSWEASYLDAEVRSQTSIIDINADVLPLWFAGVDPSRINLGLAFYGRGYTLSNTSCTDIGCPYSGPSNTGPCTQSAGLLSLQEIDELIQQQGLVPKLIPDEMVKQITWGNQWMGYDDDETFTLKRQWADSKCLGGTVAWSVDFNSGVGSGNSVISTSTSGSCGSTTAGLRTCTGSTFGGCCSSHGFCGSTPAYCSAILGCQLNFGTCSSEASISVDGSCGLGMTCQGSVFGNCCSSSGFCGSTPAYCSTALGCQASFGTCSPKALISVDGSCGGDTTCRDSAFGNCCSQYGWCGTTNAYCGDGCQNAFGICGL